MNRDALVVGINQYPFLKDTPTSRAKHLNTPASDAEAIARRLEEEGGFRVRRLPEIVEAGQRRVDPDPRSTQLDADTLENAIVQLFNPSGNSIPETALFYFSGHGLRKERGGVTEGFLATSDANPRRKQWGVSLRWLRELLQKSPVRQQIVWLDCCFAGELLNFTEADLGTASGKRTRFLIAAAREFEPAEADLEGQHGVFSRTLWQGLDPRRQPEGVVNNDTLIEHIARTLKGSPQQPMWYNPNREILLTGRREAVLVPTAKGICPYKGLRFFDVEDAPYFYGREALTEKLIERVQVGKANFLAVLGVSGSGKSSVLRAGLIYQLQQERRLPGTEEWKIRIFTPGERPLASLATAFLDESASDLERTRQLREAETAIQAGATGIARLIAASKSPRTILIADQFEEVFTVCKSSAERQQFIGSLLGAIEQTGDRLCLIFAMRDDFLGKCAAYRELADLIQANLVMVTPMSAQELRQAIVEPATKLGRQVEENLIDAILKDLGVEVQPSEEGGQISEPEPGMLPLLEYTLERLWQRQTLNWLKLEGYNQLGGVRKTLENLAEAAYKQLLVEEQRVADRIFIQLTQLGEGTPDTRKQVPQRDLIAQAPTSELVEGVIQKLAQAKLIVTSEQRKGEEKVGVVDVAHEALIRYWSRLRELLDNNREAIRTERKIQTAAEEWEAKGRSKDYLLAGLRLGEAERFLEDEADIVVPSDLAREFVGESRKERDRLNREEEERRQRELEQERKARKAAQTRTVVAIVSGVLVSATSIFANFLRQEVEKENQLRVLLEQIDTAKNSVHTEPGVTLALAIQATGLSLSQRKEVISSVQENLSSTIEEVRGRTIFLGHEGSVLSVAFSPDGQTIVSGGEDTTLRLWSLEGNQIGEPFIGHEGGVNSVAFSSDGKTIVSSDGKTVRRWNLRGSPIGQPLKDSGDGINSVNFSLDGKTIFSSSEDGTVQRWNLEGDPIKKSFGVEGDGRISIAFSPDRKTIASHSQYDETIRLWDREGNLIGESPPYEEWGRGWFCSLAFSPDGSNMIGGTCPQGTLPYTPRVRLWNSFNESNFFQSSNYDEGHENAIDFVAFSPDGGSIISVDGANIRLWRTLGTDPFVNLGRNLVLRGHQGGVNQVAFNPNGKQIVSAGYDGTLRLWDLSGIELMTIKYRGSSKYYYEWDFITSTAFSPDGQLIAGTHRTNSSGSVRLWDIKGKEIGKPSKAQEIFSSIAFSPDGQTLVSGGEDKIHLWDLKGNPIGQPFIGHKEPVASVAFSPPDGKMIASGSYDQTVRLWDLKGNPIGQPFIGHKEPVTSVAFSPPDGKMIASGSYDQTVRLWDLNGNPIGQPFMGHKEPVTSVVFSPDGKMIVSGSYDQTVRLWDLNGNPTGVEVIKGHTGHVLSVSFSPDGKSVASVDADRILRLWDIRSGDPISPPIQIEPRAPQYGGYVSSVAFSPDGKTIVTSTGVRHSGFLHLLRGNWQSWLKVACQRWGYHYIFVTPETDVAKAATATCQNHIWSQQEADRILAKRSQFSQ